MQYFPFLCICGESCQFYFEKKKNAEQVYELNYSIWEQDFINFKIVVCVFGEQISVF